MIHHRSQIYICACVRRNPEWVALLALDLVTERLSCCRGCFPKPSSSQVDFVKKASAAVNPINKFAAGEVTRDRHGTGGSGRLILSSIQGPVPRGFAEGEEGLMTMRYEHDLRPKSPPPPTGPSEAWGTLNYPHRLTLVSNNSPHIFSTCFGPNKSPRSSLRQRAVKYPSSSVPMQSHPEIRPARVDRELLLEQSLVSS